MPGGIWRGVATKYAIGREREMEMSEDECIYICIYITYVSN